MIRSYLAVLCLFLTSGVATTWAEDCVVTLGGSSSIEKSYITRGLQNRLNGDGRKNITAYILIPFFLPGDGSANPEKSGTKKFIKTVSSHGVRWLNSFEPINGRRYVQIKGKPKNISALLLADADIIQWAGLKRQPLVNQTIPSDVEDSETSAAYASNLSVLNDKGIEFYRPFDLNNLREFFDSRFTEVTRVLDKPEVSEEINKVLKGAGIFAEKPARVMGIRKTSFARAYRVASRGGSGRPMPISTFEFALGIKEEGSEDVKMFGSLAVIIWADRNEIKFITGEKTPDELLEQNFNMLAEPPLFEALSSDIQSYSKNLGLSTDVTLQDRLQSELGVAVPEGFVLNTRSIAFERLLITAQADVPQADRRLLINVGMAELGTDQRIASKEIGILSVDYYSNGAQKPILRFYKP